MVKIGIDKYEHFAVGVITAASCLWALGVWSMLLVVVVGIGKEVYDSRTIGHVADWKDAFATILGGAVTVGGWLWVC